MVLVNLQQRKIRGLVSEGMLLCAENEKGELSLVVPEKEMENYVEYISKYVGKENVYPMDIRAVGAAHIS